MRSSVTVPAPAKINVGLEVLPARGDGYHDIRGIFATVGLCDTLTVSLGGQKGTCSVVCEGMELPPQNTVTAAYKAFCVLTGREDGVCVTLTKRIPAGGGLGGGSSDASSFIQSIDMLCGTGLPEGALHEIAGQVGSDVFFFTQALLARRRGDVAQGSAFAAVVEGRGERVTPIAGRDDVSVLLVFPGVFVSTGGAYRLVDEARAQNSAGRGDAAGSRHSAAALAEMYRKPVREWFFQNDFTTPVAGQYPEIQQALAALRAVGADFVDMSGSGSSVFGIFEDKTCARRAQRILAGNWQTMLV